MSNEISLAVDCATPDHVPFSTHLEYLSSGENRAGCADLVTSPA